jgi:hypothetical protein
VRTTALHVALLLAPLASLGCLHAPDGDFAPAYDTSDPPPGPPVVEREVRLAWAADDTPGRVAVLPASALDRVMPDPVPFRLGAGHGALGHVDLEPCHALGLPAGYVKMRVTFRRDGHVSHAVVESPTPPPAAALDCVAEQLEGALVPRFDGRDATLSRSLFVESGGSDDDLQPGDTVVHKDGVPGRRKSASTSAPLTVLTRP